MQDLLSKLNVDILKQYQSLDNPDFRFAKREYRRFKYYRIIQQLMNRHYIKDETDLNIHVCMQINILGTTNNWILRISFVGPYACLLRINQGVLKNFINRHKIITSADVGIGYDSDEKYLVDCVHEFNITLLNRKILETPIPLILHDTDREYVKIYHALFEDTEILPPWE